MKATVQAALSVALILIGMVGLYFKVEYSGWVLFVGLLAAIGA